MTVEKIELREAEFPALLQKTETPDARASGAIPVVSKASGQEGEEFTPAEGVDAAALPFALQSLQSP